MKKSNVILLPDTVPLFLGSIFPIKQMIAWEKNWTCPTPGTREDRQKQSR